MSIYDASVIYAERGVPLAILGGQGVWVGVEPRLGGEGAAVAGDQVCDCGEL